jgi:hypothetical protein
MIVRLIYCRQQRASMVAGSRKRDEMDSWLEWALFKAGGVVILLALEHLLIWLASKVGGEIEDSVRLYDDRVGLIGSW